MTDDPLDPLESFRELLHAGDEAPGSSAEREIKAIELVAALSSSERVILSQIVSGWSNQDMAESHSTNLSAFMSQRKRLFAKLNAVSTSDAVRIGIYANL